ncbi:MAG: efflux RND transporter periplasmic adaptor subunit [Pseudomonadota bacterium]
MNRSVWAVAMVALAAGGVAAGYWLGTRGTPSPAAPANAQEATAGAEQEAKKERKILYYRNPMGLPDTSPVPKKDPMGMDYVPVYEGEQSDPDAPANAVKISLDKVQVLGVRTEASGPREMNRTLRAVGTVQANERLLYKVAPRFEGWIEKLHVNTTGQAVTRGQPLMEVYSPELITAQEEYLIALRGIRDVQEGSPEVRAAMERLAEGALRRLRNWEISDQELRALQQNGKPRRLLTYRAAANGVILQKPSIEGMRFMPGDVLYEIADLSLVWMLADVFEQDLGLVRLGQQAGIKFVSYPDRTFSGKVVFIYPTIDPETRTGRVRIELSNRDGLLKPAMYGTIELPAGHPKGKVLAVPDSAVLDSGTRQVVLVRRGEGLFEPRDIKTGVRADGYIEVREGLQAGEQVVVRANFLIDAESNLKAALGAFGGHGGHGGAAKPGAGKSDAATAPAAPGAQTHLARGTVDAVDTARGTVEITHGPIPSLGWPGMSMEFRVKDKAILSGVEKGEAVEFELAQPKPGEFVIERIAPAAAPPAPQAPAAPPAGHSGHGG